MTCGGSFHCIAAGELCMKYCAGLIIMRHTSMMMVMSMMLLVVMITMTMMRMNMLVVVFGADPAEWVGLIQPRC